MRRSANVCIAAVALALEGNTLTVLVTFACWRSKFGDFARGCCLFALLNARNGLHAATLAAAASSVLSEVWPRVLCVHPAGKSDPTSTPAFARL